MPDSRPIAVFDSGVGGLTVLDAIQRLLPRESTIYLGDLARCPYGVRPQAEVRDFALSIGDFLVAQDVKVLVVACNTATAAAFADLSCRYPIPVVGVIDPGAQAACAASHSGTIGVVSTDGTTASRAYTHAIHRIRPNARVLERGASWLVPMVEAGPVAREAVAERLLPVLRQLHDEGIDTLILGCTHFPLIRDLFAADVGPGVTVLDSAFTTAVSVANLLHTYGLTASGPVYHRFLVTGPAGAFTDRARAMFGHTPHVTVVDLPLNAPAPTV